MVEYATRELLRRFGSEVLAGERAGTLRRSRRTSPSGSTFLSHSTDDAELLPGVVRLLESHGAQIYVDKKDKSLPPFTSRETATALRTRIGQCHKFVLFATKTSKDSRWMPWELGIADGVKRAANTAVLPGVDTASDIAWAEREYLGVYDRIVWGNLEGKKGKVWMVLDQERFTAVELSEWLSR